MIKSVVMLLILVLGIAGVVFVIQKSTLLRSFGYDVIDFVYSLHSSEGDAEFNPNLDVYKDGMINVLDILQDRYAQEATRSGASDSAILTGILDSSESAAQTDEASGSAF